MKWQSLCSLRTHEPREIIKICVRPFLFWKCYPVRNITFTQVLMTKAINISLLSSQEHTSLNEVVKLDSGIFSVGSLTIQTYTINEWRICNLRQSLSQEKWQFQIENSCSFYKFFVSNYTWTMFGYYKFHLTAVRCPFFTDLNMVSWYNIFRYVAEKVGISACSILDLTWNTTHDRNTSRLPPYNFPIFTISNCTLIVQYLNCRSGFPSRDA